MSATGAFATIILERLLDIVTVLVLLASYVFVFGRDLGAANPVAFAAVKWAGAIAGGGVARGARGAVRPGRRSGAARPRR